MRTLIIANTGWYLYKFRYNLIQKLIQRGDTVAISSPTDDYARRLVSELGVKWYPIPPNPRRIIPHLELYFVYRLLVACLRFKPDFCLTYTPRVNCFITLVPLHTLRIKLIRNISGLGDSLLSEKKLQSKVSQFLYRRAYRCHWTFFQNEQDMSVGINAKFCKPQRTSLLPGSGVDLTKYQYCKREDKSPHRFLLAARLIPAKGYLDYIELARRFHAEPRLEFHLAGTFSDESGLEREKFNRLLEQSGVVYHDYTEDLIPLYANTDMFILPSTYGEGLPRVLLEAAASGCLLLAYNNPGSNRAIKHGENGWVTKAPTVDAMVDAMNDYLQLTHKERLQMSATSRQHVENGYSESLVLDAYLKILTTEPLTALD